MWNSIIWAPFMQVCPCWLSCNLSNKIFLLPAIFPICTVWKCLGLVIHHNRSSHPKTFWDTVHPFFSDKSVKSSDNIQLLEGDIPLTKKTTDIANVMSEFFPNITSTIGEPVYEATLDLHSESSQSNVILQYKLLAAILSAVCKCNSTVILCIARLLHIIWWEIWL